MTYVVIENCIKCKYMDCVEVCPVDCFYEGDNMLVIHPDECIDCGVCEPECPAEAIKPDTEPGLESGWNSMPSTQELAKYHGKTEAPADAKEWDGVPEKFKKFFSSIRALATRLGLAASAEVPSVRCQRRFESVNRFAKCAISPGIAVLLRHKALIPPKNVLYK